EAHAAAALEASERALQDWQQRWESHTQAGGAAAQTAQVEGARIEQLENQLRRLSAQAQRLTEERDSLGAAQAHGELDQLIDEEHRARTRSTELTAALATAHEQLQARPGAQMAAEATLEAARGAREGARAELTSLEALQAAALSDHAGETGEWLRGAGLATQPRLATALDVEAGWERAIETVLGDYLEAVCVAQLDAAAGSLASLTTGRLRLLEGATASAPAPGGTLAARVRGPSAILTQLSGALTADSLHSALPA